MWQVGSTIQFHDLHKEIGIAEFYHREANTKNLYHHGSKDILKSGMKRIDGDTMPDANIFYH